METGLPITEPEVDVKVFGQPLAIFCSSESPGVLWVDYIGSLYLFNSKSLKNLEGKDISNSPKLGQTLEELKYPKKRCPRY